MDTRIGDYDVHPVWLLNSLFIARQAVSLEHWHAFTAWVASLESRRVADG